MKAYARLEENAATNNVYTLEIFSQVKEFSGVNGEWSLPHLGVEYEKKMLLAKAAVTQKKLAPKEGVASSTSSSNANSPGVAGADKKVLGGGA